MIMIGLNLMGVAGCDKDDRALRCQALGDKATDLDNPIKPLSFRCAAGTWQGETIIMIFGNNRLIARGQA